MANDRPPRRAIPVRIKREVCARQGERCHHCKEVPVSHLPRTGTKFDHSPALRLRDVAADGRDYDPPQWSSVHIDALCGGCHDAKTFGTGATTAGSDTGKIKKERKRNRAPKQKFKWAKGRKLQGRGFQKRVKP